MSLAITRSGQHPVGGTGIAFKAAGAPELFQGDDPEKPEDLPEVFADLFPAGSG